MLKSSLVFKRNVAHLVEKKIEKTSIVFWTCILNKHDYQGLSALNMQFIFLICFKRWACKLAINGKYSKKIMTIQIVMLHLWYFKQKKNVVLKKVHSLRWLFYYVFTHMLVTFGAINFKPSEYKKLTIIWFEIIIIFLATLSKWIL
jgi:hypothetical protein